MPTRLILWSAAAVLLLAGCASSELSNDTEVTSRVEEALPVGAPAPAFIAQAIWYPHSAGFGSTDASPLGHASGVLALAGDKLYFMAWNNEGRYYDVLQRISLLRAITVRIGRFGPSAILIVESWDRSFDSFELMKKGHFASDPEATEALLGKIQALRAQRPPPDA